jgi:hypothetical protein
MNRIAPGVAAACFLVVGASACSENGFRQIAVTKSPSYVASCQDLGVLNVRPSQVDTTDTMMELTREAREKGADTLLVASGDARTGTAYLCSMPSQTAQQDHAGGSK